MIMNNSVSFLIKKKKKEKELKLYFIFQLKVKKTGLCLNVEYFEIIKNNNN